MSGDNRGVDGSPWIVDEIREMKDDLKKHLNKRNDPQPEVQKQPAQNTPYPNTPYPLAPFPVLYQKFDTRRALKIMYYAMIVYIIALIFSAISSFIWASISDLFCHYHSR